MLIFGYGSNMLLQKLKVNVPSARKIANAYLGGYVFSFNKVSKKDGSAKGNITWTGNAEKVVWGVVFEISERDKAALDREEGLGNGYNEITVSVITDKKETMEVLVYIADKSAIQQNLLPFDWYRDMVVTGAETNGLPESYIEDLKNFAFIKDNDETRRNLKYKIIEAED